MTLVGQIRAVAAHWREELGLTAEARQLRRADHAGLGERPDPGIETAVRLGADWLRAAQDHSASRDGGAARHYSLLTGWAPSYPETSGYIVPTLLDLADDGMPDMAQRARRMLDWLVSIQFTDGGFQGGTIGATPLVPVTFNTGQILIGLAHGAARLDRDRYLEPARRAARWLADSLDADGCWRKHPTPFAEPGEKAYETHVSWGLFEAARLMPDEGFGDAGSRQVRWALTSQQDNGWFDKCCLTRPATPLTHTLGYVLRGIIEAYLFREDGEFLAAARRTADGLLEALDTDGRLPGRLDRNWRPAVTWTCLTGSVQIAHCWLLLSQITGERRYLDAARAANSYVRRTIETSDNPGIAGGVRGSYPVDGGYGRYEFLNWACKFMIDSNRLERKLLGSNP